MEDGPSSTVCLLSRKTKKSQQYRGSSVIISESKKDVGVLCTWFEPTFLPQQFAVVHSKDEGHAYISVPSYVCILSYGCFDSPQKATNSIMNVDLANIDLITSDFLQLTSDAFNYIERMVNSKKSNETSSSSVSTVSLPVPDVVIVQPTTKSASCWVKHGDISLTKRHLQDLVNGKELIGSTCECIPEHC